MKLDGEVGIIGNGAGLVMSTLDVVAYAGESHGVKPANFLDIGGGASAEVMANGLDVILGDEQVSAVFVNVFGGITACDAVANGIVGALEKLGDAATKPLVVRLDGNNVEEGRQILADFAPPSRHPGRHHGRRRREGCRARRRRKGAKPDMSIFLDENSKVIVQGMTGSEGMKHSQRMLDSGTNIVGGVNPRKAGQSVAFEGGDVEVPVFGSVAEAIEATGANVSVVFVPPKFAKDAALEAIDAAIELLVIITEGIPVKDSAEFFNYAQGKGTTRIIGPNCPGVITPGVSNAGITPSNITGTGTISVWSRIPAR